MQLVFLVCDYPPQALELCGMGIATGPAPQGLAFLSDGLLLGDNDELGGLHYLATGNFQQSAFHRMGNGLLLHRDIAGDPLEFRRSHSLSLHDCVDHGLQEFSTPASLMASRKRTTWLALQGNLLIAEIEGVLEVEEQDHQPDRQARPARR